jgi:hypothetical protein
MVGTSYRVGDEDAPLFGVGALRILSKISTNKFKSGSAQTNACYGGDRRLMSETNGDKCCAGHQALARCRARGDRRMLMGCRRPCDE